MTKRETPASCPEADVLIRRLAPTDSITELTLLLHRAYRRLAELGFRYVATHQNEEITRSRIAQGECYVAVSGGRLVGTILFKPTHATSGCDYYERAGVSSFHQFAVEPSLQRHRIGMRLILQAETRARNRRDRDRPRHGRRRRASHRDVRPHRIRPRRSCRLGRDQLPQRDHDQAALARACQRSPGRDRPVGFLTRASVTGSSSSRTTAPRPPDGRSRHRWQCRARLRPARSTGSCRSRPPGARRRASSRAAPGRRRC